jgi:uncharacterized protein YjbI with pentapeptide repeats
LDGADLEGTDLRHADLTAASIGDPARLGAARVDGAIGVEAGDRSRCGKT